MLSRSASLTSWLEFTISGGFRIPIKLPSPLRSRSCGRSRLAAALRDIKDVFVRMEDDLSAEVSVRRPISVSSVFRCFRLIFRKSKIIKIFLQITPFNIYQYCFSSNVFPSIINHFFNSFQLSIFIRIQSGKFKSGKFIKNASDKRNQDSKP